MKAKYFYAIIASVVLPTLLIMVLTVVSSQNHNVGNGGFLRNYSKSGLKLVTVKRLQEDDLYIAGFHGSRIFLASSSDVHQLISMDWKLNDSKSIYLKTHSLGIAHMGVDTRIDSPFIFQSEPFSPLVLQANLDDLKFSKIYMPTKYFTSIQPLSSNTLVVRAFDSLSKQDILLKICDSEIVYGLKLKIQGDGRFSVDGMLMKNPSTKDIIYVYYYRNEFLCLDSNLNLNYRGNTIDTVQTSKIKLANIESDHSVNLATPPPFVNKKSYVYDNRLYVLSAIDADNEQKNDKKTSAVDIYNLSSGKYINSFYIPSYTGKECKSFKIVGNKLVAMYKNAVAVYIFEG